MDLKQKTIKGLSWSFASQAARQVSQFAVTVILARLLMPDDFGLVGMATVFTGFISAVNEIGVSGALIQRQQVDESHYSSVFWLNIFLGTAFTALFIAVSPAIAAFYNKPELISILRISAFNFILAAFSIVQRAIFQKHMEFKKLAVIETLAIVIGGVVGIVMAYRGFGAWSLVYQMIAFTLANTVLLWLFSHWRPRFIFSISSIKDIFGFSAHVTGFTVMNYFARNVDYLLIGKFLGAESLGYYTLAYKLMLYPLQNVTWTIQKVMFPAFSVIQNDIAKVKNAYLKMIKSISITVFPMMFGLFALAPELIDAVYGAKWLPSVIVIRIFCFCGMIQCLSSTAGTIYQSQGRSDIQFKIGFLGSLGAVLSIILGLRWGIEGVAACYTAYSILWGFYSLYIVERLISLKKKDFYLLFAKIFLISSGMFLFTLYLKSILRIHGWPELMIVMTAAATVYVFLLLVFKQIGYQNMDHVLNGKKQNTKVAPNFFCVGTKKGGTTTLQDILVQHPDIYLPKVKETKFFAIEEKYSKGIEYYKKEYFSRCNGQKAVGEIDPAYMFVPYAPSRIHKALGDEIKIIFLLRNPVDRAYSHYLMNYRWGIESRLFEEAIEAPEIVPSEGLSLDDFSNKYNFCYRETGYYAKQISAYLKFLKRSNMIFFVFEEDIKSNIRSTIESIEKFLGIRHVELNFNKISNPASMPRFRIIRDFTRKTNIVRKIGKHFFPSQSLRYRILMRIDEMNQVEIKPKPLDSSFKKYLLDKYYKEEVKALEVILNRNLSVWME